MFIDIHGHVRKNPLFRKSAYDNFSTPEELIKRYDELGVKKAVLLPLVSPEVYEPQSNGEILEICRTYPDRFIPFCNLDPRAMYNSAHSPLDQILTCYKELGFKGLGEITANLRFDDPLMDNLFAHCQEVGFPVIFDMSTVIGGRYGVYEKPGLVFLERALRLFPRLIFLGHSQPFWAEIAKLETVGGRSGYPKGPVKEEGTVPKLMRKYPNLHGDLSAGSGYNAITRDPDYGCAFLEEFQDRLYFGTDICGPETPAPLADFLMKMRQNGKISEACFQKVAWRNATRLLDIPEGEMIQ